MYCDFNTDVFKPFISMGIKIKPKLADDWVISTKAYNNVNDGFGLYSPSLNQMIQDINLRRFLDFCAKEDVRIQGDKLIGKFIIGAHRSIYTEKMYNEWLNIYNNSKNIKD